MFILFLDAVAQLTKMNPLSFEFNSRFLSHLAKEAFTGRHIEFIWNGRPLTVNDVKPNQPEGLSVFDDISHKYKLDFFLNKGYISVTHAAQLIRVKPLNLKVCPKSIEYWEEYFGRFEPINFEANNILM